MWVIYPNFLTNKELHSLQIYIIKIQILLFFFEIGANDGKLFDPMCKLVQQFSRNENFLAIMIEPMKSEFVKLQKLYNNVKNVHTECCAISNYNGTSELFISDQKGASSLLKNQNTKKNRQVKIEKVNVHTIEHVLQKYNLQKVHMFHIDAEGFGS